MTLERPISANDQEAALLSLSNYIDAGNSRLSIKEKYLEIVDVHGRIFTSIPKKFVLPENLLKFAAQNSIPINKRNALVYAANSKRNIDEMNPYEWGSRNNIKIKVKQGRDLSELDPIIYAAKAAVKINNQNPISYASEKGIKINSQEPYIAAYENCYILMADPLIILLKIYFLLSEKL